jgi:hypothetical protein
MATPLAVTYLVARVHSNDPAGCPLAVALLGYAWAMATYAALTVGADTAVYGRAFLAVAALPYLVAYNRVLVNGVNE